MLPGTLVKLKSDLINVTVYEEPVEGQMICSLSGGTIGMYLESKTDPLRKDVIYHRLVFPEIGTLFGWVQSQDVEKVK